MESQAWKPHGDFALILQLSRLGGDAGLLRSAHLSISAPASESFNEAEAHLYELVSDGFAAAN